MAILKLKRAVLLLSFTFLSVGVSSCAYENHVELDSQSHLSAIEQDRSNLYPDIETASGGALSLSLEQAMGRALRHNLDARVAVMETLIAEDNVTLTQLEALPNLSASGTFTERNNLAASSSESILTGTQSLEPSTSSEQQRRLGDLKAQWNLLDVAVSFIDESNAKDSAQSAKERLRKVQQNIERDVINAYWQAYAGQKSAKTMSGMSAQIARIEQNIHTAMNGKILPIQNGSDKLTRLLSQQSQLNSLFERTSLSQAELKAITALPMEVDIVLDTNPNDFKDVLKKEIEDKSLDYFIETALQKRPEIRESFMDTNISATGAEREILKSFPGLNLVYSRNYDSNRFLNERAWTDFTAVLTASLTNLITLPSRYKAAKNRDILEQERRKALTAAIIAQVHIAQARIAMAKANYNVAQSEYKALEKMARLTLAKKSMGASSGYDAIVAQSQLMSKDIAMHQAYAELQKAYIDMMGTVGLSISDMVIEGQA